MKVEGKKTLYNTLKSAQSLLENEHFLQQLKEAAEQLPIPVSVSPVELHKILEQVNFKP